MLQDVGLLILAFGSPQHFRKCTNTLVNRIIGNFLMHIINFDMVLLKVGIEESLGIVFSLAEKTKLQGLYLFTQYCSPG